MINEAFVMICLESCCLVECVLNTLFNNLLKVKILAIKCHSLGNNATKELNRISFA